MSKNRLRELRKEHSKTLREVATAIGTSNQNLSNWETGNRGPSLDTCEKLAAFYGVTPAYLVGWSDEK